MSVSAAAPTFILSKRCVLTSHPVNSNITSSARASEFLFSPQVQHGALGIFVFVMDGSCLLTPRSLISSCLRCWQLCCSPQPTFFSRLCWGFPFRKRTSEKKRVPSRFFSPLCADRYLSLNMDKSVSGKCHHSLPRDTELLHKKRRSLLEWTLWTL